MIQYSFDVVREVHKGVTSYYTIEYWRLFGLIPIYTKKMRQI